MNKKWYQKLLGDETMDMKERLFRTILCIGTIAIGVAVLQGLTLVNAKNLMPVYAMMFWAFVVAFVLTYRFHNSELASVILGIAIITIALPIIFIKGGGISSGAGLWMCLGIFYVFIMFTGKKLAVFLTMTILIDVGCYVVTYICPEIVQELATPFEQSFDSGFAAIIVGLTVGTILKFQSQKFEDERAITREQQEALENISRSKDVFFASMSHEIRTPINSIMGLNELILRTNPSEEVQGYAQSVKESSQMLLSLVNDILDLSQLQLNEMELSEDAYRTKKMFRELVDMMQVRAKEKKLEFLVRIDKNLPSVLYGDEKRIRQVLINILSNAVKYTEEGSVTLSCVFEESVEDKIRMIVSVADTGIGIRKEEVDYLFDAFHRSDEQRNGKIEGSGLGLAISKQILDLMGGEITVDSIYTQGSAFTVSFEQKIMDETPMGEFEKERTENTAPYYSKMFEAPEARLLIVDDDDLSQIITTKLLQDTKMSIDVSGTADDCLRKTKKRYYNIILMNHIVQGTDAVSLLKAIRKQENGLCKDAQIVLMSVGGFRDINQEYLQLGFDGILEKPVDAIRLEEEMLKHIPDELIEYRRDLQSTRNGEYFVSRMVKKRKKVYITSDGVCDLPIDYIEKYDIRLIDLYIKTEYGRFRDNKEIDIQNLSKYLSDENATAYSLAPTVEDYERFFAEALIEADEVIYLSMAKDTAHCYENAVAAAKCFDHVHVVDTGHISSGQGVVVLHAAKLASEGVPVARILEEVDQVKTRVRDTFLLPSAKIFYQKGFTNKVTAKICDTFKLYPILGIINSKITILGVRAGKLERVWKKYIRLHLRNVSHIDDSIIFVVHAGCSVRQQELLMEEINRNLHFKQVIFTQASSASTCNAGMGSIGFSIYRK